MNCLRFGQLFFALGFIGCTSQQIAGHRASHMKRVQAHQVSVKVTLDLAKSSYLAGCTKAYNSAGIKKVFFECAKSADLHVKDIESMLKDNQRSYEKTPDMAR